MIKCGVCGSENEAQALFCGTCGSPLSPAEAKAVVEEAKPVAPQVTPTDESVVPGKGGARRDLGTGGEAPTKPVTTDVTTATPTEGVGTETSGFPGPSIVCAVCGTVNDAARTYCRKCANELKPAAAAPPPPAPTAKRRGISPAIIGLAAAGVVVAVGVGIIFVLGGTGPGATATPARPSSVAVTNGPEITPGPTDGTQPTTAPTGVTAEELSGRIAFARCTGDDCVIVLISANAPTEVDELTSAGDGSADDPALAHDGQRVAYSVEDGLRIIDIGSGEILTHSTGVGDINASWSPDDSQLTFSGRRASDAAPRNDREIRLDGVTVTGPSEALTSNRVEDHDGVWSQDGASVIWAGGNGDGLDLRMINLESREVDDLTDDGTADVDPAASPDGRTIAFVSKRGSSDGFDLFLMDLETREVTPLLSMPGDQRELTWSPDGRYLAFSSVADGARDLFVMDVTDPSRALLQLTSTPEDDRNPSWGP